MFFEKVYKRRAKDGLQQNNNNNSNNEYRWVPGTPVKDHPVSKGTGLIDLNKSIDEIEAVPEVIEFSTSVEFNKGIDVDFDNERDAQLVEFNVDSGKEPEPCNHTSSLESCASQTVQQNEQEEVVVQKKGYENLKKSLKRGPKQKLKRRKIRPKVLVEGFQKKTPQPKTLNAKKTPEPKTPKPVTPKRANETTRKRKYVRKNVNANFVSRDVLDETVSKKRECSRLSSKNNSDAITELPPPPKTCRKALNFDLESIDDKAIIIAIPECLIQVDECAFPDCKIHLDECDTAKALPELEVQVDNECVDARMQCENKKVTGMRSRRRRRRNAAFMWILSVLQVQNRRRRRLRRATKRCDITLLSAIPICSQLPKLPSKQVAPSDNAIPICSQLPKFPSKQGAPIKNEIPICSHLPQLLSRQAASSENEEADIIYEPEASKIMLLTNNIGKNIAGRTRIEPCVADIKKNERIPFKYEDFLQASYLTGIDSQNSMIRKHPLEPENFGIMDQTISSQKVLQEPGMGLQEGLQKYKVLLQEFLQERRMGAPPLFLEKIIDSLAPFPGQSSGSGQSMGAKELLPTQNVGALGLFPEQNIGAVEPILDQSSGAPELSQRQAFDSQEIYSLEFSREQEMNLKECLQKQIIGPSSLQVFQEQNSVIQRKNMKHEDLCLTAQSRGLQGMIQIERGHIPTRKRSLRLSRGSQVGMNQQLIQPTTADIIREFEALSIRDGGNRLMQQDNKAHGPNNGYGAVVPYQVGPTSVHGAVIPYQGKEKRKKLRPKVHLDPRTVRMWNLIMNIDDRTSKDQTSKEDMEKWWEKEREVFGGRIQSFTARMHLILGDRRFKPWKGSVVDSVVGVYLTQNVSDNLSSNAYMSLAARFPSKSIESNPTSNGGVYDSEGNMYFVTEPEPDRCCELKDRVDPFDSRIQGKSLLEIEDKRVMKDAVASQTFDTFSVKSLNRIQLCPTGNSKADVASPNKACSAESTTISQLFPTGNLKADVASPRIDNGSQTSTSGRNDLKSDCGSISLTDVNDPFEILISTLIQESSGTGMLQDHDATTMSKKSPRGKGPKLNESKSNMKNDGTKKTILKKKDDNQEKGWDILRRIYSIEAERSCDQVDSVDWEAVRCAEVSEIADAIKGRGQQNIIAGRIKDFLNRLVDLHSSIDLEWLRNVPPDKVKKYLLEIQGLGLKSVECVRLLSLQHIAFPVDVNVGRIAVRLGWVPLQPLPGNLHIHLLEEYPVMDTIQVYLWPRLCCLDQKTLYELHYQMITFGKVFCKKRNPNCGACPLRGECKHFASAFASARLALPGPSEKGIVTSEFSNGIGGNPPLVVNPTPVIQIEADPYSESGCQINNCEPIIEDPQSPEPQCEESPESDIDDDYNIGDIEDIPTIRLQEREFKENVQNFIEMNKIMLQDSCALVLLTAEAASIPAMKLKKYAPLRTEHTVYVIPDNHELLRGFERRDPDDPSPYLLAIWLPGETPNSIVPPQYTCNSKGTKFCSEQMCYSCNSTREKNAGLVRGTILIPCRTANRGRFPLNGTYFQVNEVFADHETSNLPINVPRHMIANLPRQKVFFGSSATSIFNALHLREIQECFWRGYVCVRGFDRRYRCPMPLTKRLHCSPSKMEAGSKRPKDET